MNPLEDTSSVNNTPSVPDIEMGDAHTKDTKDGATASVATPKQNISNPDHDLVMESAEGPNLNDNNVRREHVPEAAERIVDAAVQNFKELVQGGAKFRFEIDDGKGNIFVMSRNADPPKIEVNSSKLSQVALTICAQSGAVFVANALNKSASCSRAASLSPSPSPSHSDIPGWMTDTIIVSNLIGFVSALIATSLENQKSPSPKRKWTISSVAGKLGLVAAASAMIVSTGAALPLGINGNLAVTGVVSLPALVAVVLA